MCQNTFSACWVFSGPRNVAWWPSPHFKIAVAAISNHTVPYTPRNKYLTYASQNLLDNCTRLSGISALYNVLVSNSWMQLTKDTIIAISAYVTLPAVLDLHQSRTATVAIVKASNGSVIATQRFPELCGSTANRFFVWEVDISMKMSSSVLLHWFYILIRIWWWL